MLKMLFFFIFFCLSIKIDVVLADSVSTSFPSQFFGGNIYPPSYTASGTPTIPSAPQSAYLQTLSGDSILVNFAAPESDGGSLATSYRVEWDARPHIAEVQTVTTQVYTGPNEVQRIESFMPKTIYEVQAIRTLADPYYEIQTVRTVAALGETLAGSFTLLIDSTAFGGGAYTTGTINFDAPAMAGAGAPRTSMQEALEAVPGVGRVSVTASSPDEQNGILWTITFLDLLGNVPEIQLGSSSLRGVGADVLIDTNQDGEVISGTFVIGMKRPSQIDPSRMLESFTSPLPFDATPAEMQTALEGLPTIDQVIVDRVSKLTAGSMSSMISPMLPPL
jgi:hypothetical protein